MTDKNDKIRIFLILITFISISINVFILTKKDADPIDMYYPVTIEKEVIKEIAVEKDKMETKEFIHILNSKIDPVIANEIGNAVDKYSVKYQIPKKLILSIIDKESKFDPMAKSSVGALGLMQVYPKYHKDKMDEMGITKNTLTHIDPNIDIGCRIWKDYFDQSKEDIDKTFHRYLSKNATEKQKNDYMNDILVIWAKLEFIEYTNTIHKEKEIISEENEVEEKPEADSETEDSETDSETEEEIK